MLQVFSLRLSTFAESYPVTVYGIFAVRDELEPLRNYVFNRSRDDAVMVDKDPFTLPLCSPCRGMYLLDSVLFEVDLWIKKEGDGSADKPLLAEYAELEMRSEFNETLRGCIPSDSCSLDIDYNVLTEAVEAVIEVSADIDQLHHVRITAFSSCLDHEFVLFDDEFSGKKLFKHVLAVKANEKLDVRLELEESLFQWTFQDADVGAVCCADESISKYGQFDVTVAYANDHPALMAMGDSYPGELKRNNICRSEEESDDNLDYDDNDGVVTDEETNYPDLSTFGHHKPNQMLQIFSACLSSSAESYPISVYGIVAIWDYLEPLHNHVFNQARDDAAMIEQDSLTLPLCSPCRGMYVQDRALLEVDLWVKKEGDGSADKQLLSAYVELDVGSDFNEMLNGRIPRDCCSMDIDYMILTEGIEAVIEVSAEVDCPRHVRFAALSSPFDREIVLFDEKNCGMKLFKHVIAVKAKEELDICLELERSLFQWTFQDGNVGAVSFPDDSILKYGQFHVSVLFVPNNRQTKSKITVIA